MPNSRQHDLIVDEVVACSADERYAHALRRANRAKRDPLENSSSLKSVREVATKTKGRRSELAVQIASFIDQMAAGATWSKPRQRASEVGN